MKILVVGAGIAGPTLAYWLLQAGHEPTLVERAPELRRGGYLVDFWGAGFDVAERMGIVGELRRRGYEFSEARSVTSSGRRIGAIDPAVFAGATGDRYLSIARSDLADVIYQALEGQAELVLGDSVTSLDEHSGGVRVRFDSGSERDFDLVVGADGLHSRVRRLAFGPEEQFESYLGTVVAVFDVTGYRHRDENVAIMHAEVGFQAVRVSLREDVTMFVFTVRHDKTLPIDDGSAQRAFLRDRLGAAGWETPEIVAELGRARNFYFDRVSQIRMPSWSRGRVALIGDAGACPSLLAGQGSALAMTEAYVLAVELARSADHGEAFARWERRLADFVRSKQDAAVGLGAAFAPANRLQLFVRNAGMMLMGLPKVAEIAIGKSLLDKIELPAFAVT